MPPFAPSNPPTAADLGDLIFRENPYGQSIELMLKGIEQDTKYTGTWDFRTGSYRIAKALRIPYCYKDAQGVEIKEYLLIGYEGSGGI
ncbi:MAG: hypothetical protein HY359_05165 [Candidatus Rokubacteria bacterium]|nr:hypothetical protein [Candidatus Rokubacteria bacterium]